MNEDHSQSPEYVPERETEEYQERYDLSQIGRAHV